jgi:drug/metabolite transporter (DMT)-like permease
MAIRLLGVLAAFLVSCLAAALAMVLFVLTPAEIAGLPPDVRADRVTKSIELTGFVAAQFALFSTPFALVVAAVGEMIRNRSWTYYVLAGLAIAGLGFFAQQSTEQAGQPTIANNYALTAFLTSGFVGGLVYWIIRGRFAGGPGDEQLAEPAAALRTEAASTGTPAAVAPQQLAHASASATTSQSADHPAGQQPDKA